MAAYYNEWDKHAAAFIKAFMEVEEVQPLGYQSPETYMSLIF